MIDLTPEEIQSLRRALQVARADREHEVRNWEFGSPKLLESHRKEIRQFSALINKLSQPEPVA